MTIIKKEEIEMYKKGMCSCCKKEVATEKVVNRKLCVKCFLTRCPICTAVLSEEEKNAIPIFGEINDDYRIQLLGFNKPWKPCSSCFSKKMQKGMQAELQQVENKWQFQIKYQNCQRCGVVNNSRSEGGIVESRFCKDCRKIFGDDSSLRAMDEKRPSAPKDNRLVIFDRVVGFRDR
jgi:hypothetical protein